ncbi:MAG: UDP-N-acetylmuramoyl-L-alanyl-D-glutamate--2,6-diaminopimelate ligase [Ardenticatenia bacterium]|nr:UDP-N-acetylmuramoyl-L-alanyl-D-glutamate--2,6-diaminopimelate ligase [Ardenticatenia bacterium]
MSNRTRAGLGPMPLVELLSALPAYRTRTETLAGIRVRGITGDSRRVEHGMLFVAYPGVWVDAHRYIPDAVARGAVAVVGERPADEYATLPVPYIQVPDGREALAWLAAAWYGHPSRQVRVVGITGTDGKTTTTALTAAVLEAMGATVGVISTIGARIGHQHVETGAHVTTPDALETQHYLRQMVENGAHYAVIETTSHGLAQHRVTGVAFDVAVVTNITHEHLDIHGTVENYRKAKAMLFASLATTYRKPETLKVSILNADDSSYQYLRHHAADVTLTYGVEAPADVRAVDIQYTNQGTRFTVESPTGRFELFTHLLGAFNVYNALAATAVGLSQGATAEQVQAGIARVERVTGRMEPIDEGQEFLAIVDFAHTPVSLEQALKAARTMAEGRVIVVFGSAGLRDVAKRSMMGRVAARLADLAVFTAEDPRTEDVNEIIAEIARGARAAGAREGRDYVCIPDRAAAIEWAIFQAQPGDVVMACGKGHEPTMCYGETEYPWNEHDVMRAAIRKRQQQGQ